MNDSIVKEQNIQLPEIKNRDSIPSVVHLINAKDNTMEETADTVL